MKLQRKKVNTYEEHAYRKYKRMSIRKEERMDSHISRMILDRIVKIACDKSPLSHRAQDWPRKRWSDNLIKLNYIY